jgi:hypothetical protein
VNKTEILKIMVVLAEGGLPIELELMGHLCSECKIKGTKKCPCDYVLDACVEYPWTIEFHELPNVLMQELSKAYHTEALYVVWSKLNKSNKEGIKIELSQLIKSLWVDGRVKTDEDLSDVVLRCQLMDEFVDWYHAEYCNK